MVESVENYHRTSERPDFTRSGSMSVEWVDRSGAFEGRERPMRLSIHPRRGATTQRPYDVGMIHFDASVGPRGGAKAPVDPT